MSTVDAWVHQARRAHVKEMARLPRPGLARVRDLVVAGLPARLYLPRATERLPVLVYFHGGGWVLGDIDSYDPAARTLALASDAAVLSINYRRPPEAPFPAAVEDAEAAVHWTFAHATALGLDPARIGVAGDSAGGQICVATALRLAASSDGPQLALQLLIYPALDLRAAPPVQAGASPGDGATRRLLERMFTLYLGETDRSHPEASPLLAPDLARLPTTVMVTAEHDLLRPQGEEFAHLTREAGVDTTLFTGHGLAHGFLGREPSADQPTSLTRRFGRQVATVLNREDAR